MGLYPPKQCITLGNQVASMLVATSKVTNQGQISVPAEVRKDLGIRAGTELIWDRNENGDYTVRPKRIALADLHRMVGPSTVRLTDQEIQKARQEFLASRMKRLDAKKA
jgi:AbrB family looped-hinge helix DNA binding protein